MKKNNTTTYGNQLTKKENFLVNAFVFFTFLSFFTNFPIAFGGVFRLVLGGKLPLLLLLAQFIIFLYNRINSPNSFSGLNGKFAILFSSAIITIFLLVVICVSEIDTVVILPLFNVAFLFSLRDDLKLVCVDRFIRVLAVILALSLLEYFIYIIFHTGIRLFTNLNRVGFEDETNYAVFDQYLFNIYISGSELPRFQSLCEEPGCVGTICGFLIFLTQGKKEYRFHYSIFMLSGAMAFSLAFFALLAIHLLLYGRKASASSILLAVLFVAAFFYFYELFENNVLYRLGGNYDNRVRESFDMMFMDALKNGELWLPHGAQFGNNGAGAKVWLWRYGIVSFILLFFSYYYYYWAKAKQYKSNTWRCVLFFGAFWVSFYQRQWITNLDYMIVFLTAPIMFGINSETSINNRS